MYIYIYVSGMLRNAIIVLTEHGTTGIQKHIISYAHSKNIYSLLNNTINLRKAIKPDIFKATKRCVQDI